MHDKASFVFRQKACCNGLLEAIVLTVLAVLSSPLSGHSEARVKHSRVEIWPLHTFTAVETGFGEV